MRRNIAKYRGITCMPASPFARSPEDVTLRASDLHAESIVIDGSSFFLRQYNERIRQSGLTAINFMAPMPQDDTGVAIGRIREYYEIARRDPKIEIVWNVSDIERCKREGKLGAIIGCQNARFLGTELGNVEVFARLGLRVLQLTYNERNYLADGCLEPANDGLSFFGKQVVREANAFGLVIDLSHCGHRSSLEAAERSEHPVVISHAGIHAITNNPRTVKDDQIKAVASRGGVIGISSFPTFNWRGDDRRPHLSDFLDSIEYAIQLVGPDHVGYGSDYVAEPGGYPQSLRDYFIYQYDDYSPGKAAINKKYREITAGVSKEDQLEGYAGFHHLPRVTQGLLDRGHSEADVQKVLGQNFMRVFRTVWASAPLAASHPARVQAH
jgi:membrane dipeptidase